MLNNLKNKLKLIYVILILWIAILGGTSIYNISVITKLINEEIVDIYKNINALSQMEEALENQNNAINLYLYDDKESGISEFHNNGYVFTELYYSEKNNTIENQNESSIINISDKYKEFCSNFSLLQELYNTKGKDEAIAFYKSNMKENYDSIKITLTSIIKSYEKIIISNKTNIVNKSINTLYILLIILIIALISGYIISNKLCNKLLKPLSLLKKSIKSVKDGKVGEQIPVITKDELGDVIVEFNKMSKSLEEVKKKSLNRINKSQNIENTNLLKSLCHEFKPPLTSIMLGTTLLENVIVGDLNEKQRKVLETMKNDGEILNNLVSNILILDKLQCNKEFLSFNVYSMLDIVKDSLHYLNKVIKEKKLILEYEVTKDLPNVKVDKEKLAWVINGIVINSIKYCSEGDSIIIRVFKKNNEIYVTISDTGIGIPQDRIESIFHNYAQNTPHSSYSNKVILGLALCKEIIKIHRGNIWCQSIEKQGTNFYFTLPICENEKITN